MAEKVSFIPVGYSNISPYLICKGADKVIEFLIHTFNSEILDINKSADGTIMHATAKIGSGTIMLSEGSDKFPPMPAMIHVYVENCDEAYKRAVEAHGESIREPQNEFYGDRSSGVKDPAGNHWWISTHIEDISQEEMEKRMKEWEKNRNPDQSKSE